jgi:hypothetical protein
MSLSDFDKDVLKVAIAAFRNHDPTLSEKDAEPVFIEDWPTILSEVSGYGIGTFRLRWQRLRGRLPVDRGRVGGRLFWLRRDVVEWAVSGARKHRPE